MNEASAATEGSEPAAPQLNEQEQASLELARNGLPEVDPNAQTPAAPQRPDDVPEKFWDAEKGAVNTEALLKSYVELEKVRSKPAEENTEEAPKAEVGKDGKITKAAEPKEDEAKADENPLNSLFDLARSDYASNQGFSEETATKLAEAGIPLEIQQVYLAGLNAMVEQQNAKIHGVVGGEDQYNAMAQWAGQALSDDELEAFNAALDNPQLAETAVTGLYARYKAARPSEGRMTAPTNGAPAAGDIYQSKDEFVSDIQNPRYTSDPAFRRGIEEKLARSRAAGFRVAG